MNNFLDNSRATHRAKKKKINIILNGSIVIVLILIGFVSYSIFSGGDDKAASHKSVETSAEKQSDQNIKKDEPAEKKSSSNDQTNDDSSSKDETQSDQTQSDKTNSDDAADNASTASSDSSQENAPTSPAPETPAQTGQPHVTNYDSSSQDWQQMLQAISSATGIDQSNMTVWFLGSDKSNPGGSVGTISAKTQGSPKYRVYLQWTGSGYQATNVEPAS